MIMNFNYRGKTIELNEAEQDEIYQFYRLHNTIEALEDYLSEYRNLMFYTVTDATIVAKRVLECMDDYHVSEEEAICTICADVDYIQQHTVEEDE